MTQEPPAIVSYAHKGVFNGGSAVALAIVLAIAGIIRSSVKT